MRYRVYPLWDSPPTGKRVHGRPRQMLAGRAAEFCIAPRCIPIIPQGCTCALLTIRGLASFLALFVVTQYSAKLGLRAGFLLEAVFVAAMAALLFVLLRNRPADKGLSLSPAAW